MFRMETPMTLIMMLLTMLMLDPLPESNSNTLKVVRLLQLSYLRLLSINSVQALLMSKALIKLQFQNKRGNQRALINTSSHQIVHIACLKLSSLTSIKDFTTDRPIQIKIWKLLTSKHASIAIHTLNKLTLVTFKLH